MRQLLVEREPDRPADPGIERVVRGEGRELVQAGEN